MESRKIQCRLSLSQINLYKASFWLSTFTIKIRLAFGFWLKLSAGCKTLILAKYAKICSTKLGSFYSEFSDSQKKYRYAQKSARYLKNMQKHILPFPSHQPALNGRTITSSPRGWQLPHCLYGGGDWGD